MNNYKKLLCMFSFLVFAGQVSADPPPGSYEITLHNATSCMLTVNKNFDVLYKEAVTPVDVYSFYYLNSDLKQRIYYSTIPANQAGEAIAVPFQATEGLRETVEIGYAPSPGYETGKVLIMFYPGGARLIEGQNIVQIHFLDSSAPFCNTQSPCVWVLEKNPCAAGDNIHSLESTNNLIVKTTLGKNKEVID